MVAFVFLHELVHVVQFGYGFAPLTLTEGHATFFESFMTGLPLRPFPFLGGSVSWQATFQAHRESLSLSPSSFHPPFLASDTQSVLSPRPSSSRRGKGGARARMAT